jgi:hypothetical protein
MSARCGSIFLAMVVLSFGCAYAQELPSPGDSRHSMLREAMLGLLGDQRARPAAEVRQRCLKLPVDPPSDRLEGPHGATLISQSCRVTEVRAIGTGALSQWTMARYQSTSIFTAEDRSRGDEARDTVTEEEVVVFDAPDIRQLRPVWHARFETGAYAVWRSITPELAVTAASTTLLSVMSCVNGTGGCGQEFLQRTGDGRWRGVNQEWLDQLPAGFAGRILHGVRIDPTTLRGEAGFYGDRDPNCCPSERLEVELALDGDALVLRHQNIVKEPTASYRVDRCGLV